MKSTLTNFAYGPGFPSRPTGGNYPVLVVDLEREHTPQSTKDWWRNVIELGNRAALSANWTVTR